MSKTKSGKVPVAFPKEKGQNPHGDKKFFETKHPKGKLSDLRKEK